MKNVLLSADSEISVYSVPDEVADSLEEYCLEFSCNWLHNSPDAAKYRIRIGDTVGVSYTECDFIDYLNEYVCRERSVLVEKLNDVYDLREVPGKYARLPWFSF